MNRNITAALLYLLGWAIFFINGLIMIDAEPGQSLPAYFFNLNSNQQLIFLIWAGASITLFALSLFYFNKARTNNTNHK